MLTLAFGSHYAKVYRFLTNSTNDTKKVAFDNESVRSVVKARRFVSRIRRSWNICSAQRDISKNIIIRLANILSWKLTEDPSMAFVVGTLLSVLHRHSWLIDWGYLTKRFPIQYKKEQRIGKEMRNRTSDVEVFAESGIVESRLFLLFLSENKINMSHNNMADFQKAFISSHD